MNSKYKKVLAREVIYVFITLGAILLSLLLSYLYNINQDRIRSNVYKDKMQFLEANDNLLSRYNLYQSLNTPTTYEYDLYEFWQGMDNLNDLGQIQEGWNIDWDETNFKKDLRKFGLNSAEEMIEFIESTPVSKAQYDRLKIFEIEISELEEFDIGTIPSWVAIVCGIVLFVLRYSYYVIIWSIRTLKS